MIEALNVGPQNRRYLLRWYQDPVRIYEGGVFRGDFQLAEGSTPDNPIVEQAVRLDGVELYHIDNIANTVELVRFEVWELRALLKAIEEVAARQLPPAPLDEI